jgi:hypothetical protein
MAEKREYRFKIDAYTRETMPMGRLAGYLADLAILFGEDSGVHLIGVETSSTCPVILVDWEAEPKVRARVNNARNRVGPEDAVEAVDSINQRLARDNASAVVLDPTRNNVIAFPGARTPRPIEWPSVNQRAELYGIPIMIGGRNDPVPVHLLDGTVEYKCVADRTRAKEIASYLFSATLRVAGRGRWRRLASGVWNLERFVIEEVAPVKFAELDHALRDLRSVPAQWKNIPDPLSELEEIRDGGAVEKPNGGIRQ